MMRVSLRSFVAPLLAFFCSTYAAAQSTQLGYFRAPSIAGDTVVFVAEGDLWRSSVSAVSSGVAQRLTTHLGPESNPSISPDGKWVAFTASYEGPAEVYVMPIDGGLPKRLTFEGDTARVQGWVGNDQVLYASRRYIGKNEPRLQRVNVTTRAVSTIPLHEAAEGCLLGNDLIFARLPLLSDNVKNYQGGSVQQLWRFDGSNEATLISGAHKGTARQPMCAGGRVYFLSDRNGGMNVWSMTAKGDDWKQHTRFDGKQDFDIRGASASADAAGKVRVVFQHGADLKLLDASTGNVRTLSVQLQSDFEHTRTRWIKNPWDFVTSVNVSPNGNRVAVTARGHVFTAPVGAGRRVNVSNDANTRVRSATFSHDGKSVYAFSDRSGEFELTQFPANGVGGDKQLTKGATTLRRQVWPSPDGKWIVHLDHNRQLWLYNVGSSENKLIDRSAWGDYTTITWSPDSRWLAFPASAKNDFEVLHLLEIASGKKTAVTSDRYHASSPAFSPDGKWLYFIGNRHLQSLVTNPWGQRNPEPFFDRQGKLYAVALDPKARWPFLPKDELQTPEKPAVDAKPTDKPTGDKAAGDKAEAKKPDAPAAKAGADAPKDAPKDTPKDISKDAAKESDTKPITIVLEGLRERLYEVPVPPNNYSNLSTDGKRLFFVVTDTGTDAKQHLRSVAIEAPNPTPPTIDNFIDDVRNVQLTQDRKKILVRKANELFVFDVGKSAPPPPEQAKFQVNLRDWTFPLSPRDEWRQMFVDAWRMHRDYFYDVNMHGVDWKAMRAKYAPLVERVTDRAELSDVLAQLISELSALHSQVGANDIRRGSDTIDIGFFAADFDKAERGFRVTRIMSGDPELLDERSPLSRAEIDIRVGDVITAVNGVAAGSAATIGELTRETVGKQVLLSTLRGDKPRDVIVTPISVQRDRALRYLDWERTRGIAVDKVSDQRIGYLHLQAMTGADIARWAREFYPVYQREGLIIDLRDNGGGSIDSWIIEKLQRRAWHYWKSRRDDEPFHNQQLAFRGHVVALIDGGTYSDGETMAQGLRRLGIATLIGTKTAGAGIWLSDQNRLVDNGIARAAESGSFVDTPKERAWITEFVGVEPDIRVDNLPHETFKGRDAQLEAAISFLQERMKKEPMRTPTPPPFPVMAR